MIQESILAVRDGVDKLTGHRQSYLLDLITGPILFASVAVSYAVVAIPVTLIVVPVVILSHLWKNR